ncbi:MAG: glycosyltransferase involved in cell wall biosynthesis [Alteromonas naphthalenivorans]|jgi:glycosyltransferase involved in cell wall biosynthesis
MKKVISVVIPIYNEEENISLIYQALYVIFEDIKDTYDYQLLFINDGSRDNSWSLIQELSKDNKHVVGLSFSRNFGYQMALTAGHDYAQGDAVITIDADLQDPPELILDMIRKWEQGFLIVYAKRIARNDGWLKDSTAALYYKLLALVADIDIPRNVGDFRLLDKKVVHEIRKCKEISRYWRGLVAWTGFRSTFIEFTRPERIAGETGYTWKKLIKLAFDGLTSFSLFPLEIAAYVGLFVCATGLFMFCYITWDALVRGAYYPLFKWLSVMIYIAMGIQCLLLWFLGKYVGKIYFRQKKRPLYIIDEHLGFEEH